MSMPPTISGPSVTPESPWLGLRSFTEEAQSFFFGRNAELDDLYERILDKPLAILFGQSGLGKSSLLQAALVPRLRTTGFLPVFVRLDHDTNAPPPESQLLHRLRIALESAGYPEQAATLSTALANGTAARITPHSSGSSFTTQPRASSPGAACRPTGFPARSS